MKKQKERGEADWLRADCGQANLTRQIRSGYTHTHTHAHRLAGFNAKSKCHRCCGYFGIPFSHIDHQRCHFRGSFVCSASLLWRGCSHKTFNCAQNEISKYTFFGDSYKLVPHFLASAVNVSTLPKCLSYGAVEKSFLHTAAAASALASGVFGQMHQGNHSAKVTPR